MADPWEKIPFFFSTINALFVEKTEKNIQYYLEANQIDLACE